MKKKAKRKSFYQKEAYLFILPIFLFFAVYSVYPLLFNVYYAFTDWNGMSQEWNWVGWANFKELLSDRVVRITIKNTIIFFIFTVIPQAVIGLVLAFVITNMKRFSSFFRALFYFPNIIPFTIICVAFKKIFEGQGGELNQFLTFIGLESLTQHWLATPDLALSSLIVINVWTYISFSMFLYCVNMTNIPTDLYEAATLDGAGGFQKFRYITFPLLMNTHMTLILLGMISTIKNFDLPYVVTGGGPAHGTEFMSTYMYYLSFDRFEQGTASAVVCLMLIFCVVLTVFQLRMYGIGLKSKED